MHCSACKSQSSFRVCFRCRCVLISLHWISCCSLWHPPSSSLCFSSTSQCQPSCPSCGGTSLASHVFLKVWRLMPDLSGSLHECSRCSNAWRHEQMNGGVPQHQGFLRQSYADRSNSSYIAWAPKRQWQPGRSALGIPTVPERSPYLLLSSFSKYQNSPWERKWLTTCELASACLMRDWAEMPGMISTSLALLSKHDRVTSNILSVPGGSSLSLEALASCSNPGALNRENENHKRWAGSRISAIYRAGSS